MINMKNSKEIIEKAREISDQIGEKEIDAELLVKLTVQKCIDIINDIDEDEDREAGLFSARWNIQKYFGV